MEYPRAYRKFCKSALNLILN
jgi:NAD(P)H-flavin reductase